MPSDASRIRGVTTHAVAEVIIQGMTRTQRSYRFEQEIHSRI